MGKFRIGLIGAGGMGMCHYAAYEGIDDLEVVAVCDVRIDELKEKIDNKNLHFYNNLDEMLESEQLDIVDIVTPSYMHKDMVIKCLKRGLHVLSEKPMALNSVDAKEIVAAANAADKKFMVAHVVRFMKPYSFLARELTDERNGALVRLDMKRISSVPRWSWKNWMLDEEKSGGVGLDLSIHDLDFVLSVLGEPNDISAVYRSLKNDSSVILSNLKYDDALVTCEGTWYNAKTPFRAEFYAVFDNGYISYADGKLVKNDEEIDLNTVAACENLGINVSGDEAYHNEIAYFVNCIKNNIDPDFVTPESSAKSVEVMEKLINKATLIK